LEVRRLVKETYIVTMPPDYPAFNLIIRIDPGFCTQPAIAHGFYSIPWPNFQARIKHGEEDW
jgi:hypothetical protein